MLSSSSYLVHEVPTLYKEMENQNIVIPKNESIAHLAIQLPTDQYSK